MGTERGRGRGRRLIRWELQLRASAMIFNFCVVGLIVYLSLLQLVLERLEARGVYLPLEIVHFFREGFLMAFGITVGIMLPFAFSVGILGTFSVAAPLARVKRLLLRMARGDLRTPVDRTRGRTPVRDMEETAETLRASLVARVEEGRRRADGMARALRGSPDPDTLARIAGELARLWDGIDPPGRDAAGPGPEGGDAAGGQTGAPADEAVTASLRSPASA